MENAGWAGLGIIPTFDGFQSKLEQGSAKHLAAAGVTGGEKFGDEAGKSAGRKFSSRIKTAAKVGAGILAVATAGAVRFTNDALAEAREAQKIGALTTSTIKATGKAAKVTAKHVGDLSGAISEQAGIDDEVIQRGANMILTFKNIRNEQGKNNKVFDESVKVTADMAAAMAGGSGEVDLKSSAILVGKALNDPVKGLTALSRVGVTFTEQQKDQIKTLVESGDSMKAQKVILRELQSEFGGAAAAQSTAGEKLSVTWGNFKEDIGTQLLPTLDDLQNWMRKKGIPMLRDFSDWFSEEGGPAIGDFVTDAKPFVKDVLTKTRDILREATPLAKKFVGFFKEIPSGVWQTAAAVGLLGAAGSKIPGAKAGLKLGGKAAGGLAGGLVRSAKPIPVFVVNEGFGGAGAVGGKKGWLKALAGWGGIATVAAVAAGAGTKGIMDLNQKVAPKAADKGIQGTPSFGQGLANGGFLQDIGDKADTAADKTKRLNGQIETMNGLLGLTPRKIPVKFETPGLDRSQWLIKQYGSMLDGLDGRVVKTFIQSRLDHNEGQLERFGGYRASGGRVRPGEGYVVGEKRAEWFEPDTPGRIHPTVPSGKREYHFHGIQNLDALRREVQHTERAEAIGAFDFR